MAGGRGDRGQYGGRNVSGARMSLEVGETEGCMMDAMCKEPRCDLTRFNKICHPSQRPRWQVDKEAIGLSRVQQCSFTYNPPS